MNFILIRFYVKYVNVTFFHRLGESCSHVGALLFKLEAAVRAGYTKRACTEEACAWNNDFVKKVQPAPIANIHFYSTKAVNESKRKKASKSSDLTSSPSASEKEELLQQLSLLKDKSVVLHSFSGYADSFVPKNVPPKRAKLPDTLRSLYSSSHSSLNPAEFERLVKRTFENMLVTQEVADYVFATTKKQAACNAWHEVRTGRITASSAHDVLHTNFLQPSTSLVKRICKESCINAVYAPSLQWGIDHEKTALKELELYLGNIHSSFELNECGMKLCLDHSFIGATPDGMFSCKCHNLQCLIEIKCPFTARESKNLEEMIRSPGFFIDATGKLKQNNRYYTQVQLQLHVFGYETCYFVVWAPNWMYLTEITREDNFIKTMTSRIVSFYKSHIIPELLTRSLENSGSSASAASNSIKDANKKYCFCQSEHDDTESWIGCDSADCKYEWFHLSCLKMKRIPKGTWYCQVCKKNKQKKK